ncbi:MAG: ABC transporter permease subunit [Ruminococcus sp.]|nr:ABC transporter permease subunit [Ruminococcus sp.]
MLRLIRLTLRLHIKRTSFALAAAAALFIGVMFGLGNTKKPSEDFMYSLDETPFVLAGMIVSVITVWSVCTEFSDGTVRSKLITGVSKAQFITAQIVASAVDAALVFLLTAAPLILLGNKQFYSLYSSEILFIAFGLILLYLVFNGVLCAVISCIIQSKVIALILCAGMWFGLNFAATQLNGRLSEPQFSERLITDIVQNKDTGKYEEHMSEVEYTPNSRRVSGAERETMKVLLLLTGKAGVYTAETILNTCTEAFTLDEYLSFAKETVNDKLTWGSCYMFEGADGFAVYPLWTLGECAVFTAIGVLIFRKRNIY